jgi:hypothetical protein
MAGGAYEAVVTGTPVPRAVEKTSHVVEAVTRGTRRRAW